MGARNATTLDRTLQGAQLLTLIIGIVVVAMKVGAKEQQLVSLTDAVVELKGITSSQAGIMNGMLIHQADSDANDRSVRERIEAIERRIERIDRTADASKTGNNA